MESRDHVKKGRDLLTLAITVGPGSSWGMGRPCLLDSPNSWIPLPQALPLPSQGLQMGWLPCPGLLCLFSWPLLGLDPSRRGPWTGVSSPKTGRMLAVPPMSCATASTETYGSEASSLVPLASLGATSWSILVSLAPDLWLLFFLYSLTTFCVLPVCLTF